MIRLRTLPTVSPKNLTQEKQRDTPEDAEKYVQDQATKKPASALTKQGKSSHDASLKSTPCQKTQFR